MEQLGPAPAAGAICTMALVSADSRIAELLTELHQLIKQTQSPPGVHCPASTALLSFTRRYEVDDIDEEGKERHTLSRRHIIPLPQWKANPETDPEALFQKEQLVLALYPQTTCFYRALIHTPPQRPQDDYSVLFEDTSYADGYCPPLNVAQRYVVACKEPKKK
ncbi:SAGA-associated factor 29 like protein [Myotis brandtii]|uniref:SAGA-associated factor 29 like protein n=1 Tax=Myotis brandtii TaxID=109478 RepID=S7Q2J7_MYOBR|nr:SAGA-associated factor 29 like protein [Myotis brandtii]